MFRAFIIDDDKSAIQITRYMFPWDELEVSSIEEICSPIGLVERITTETPDLVFIDIEMDTISGLDIIEKCIENGSNALFVIISGHDNFRYAHKAVNIGVVHYLLKPLDPADVFTVTQKLKARLAIRDKEDISTYLSDSYELGKYLASYLTPNEHYRLLISTLSDNSLTEIKFLLDKCLLTSFKVGLKKILFILKHEAFDKHMELTLNNYTKNKRLLLCISSEFTSGNNIADFFNQVNTLSYQDFIEPVTGILFNQDTPTAPLKNIVDNLTKSIDSHQIASIIHYLEELPALFVVHHYTLEHVTALYNTIITRVTMSEVYKKIPFPYSQMGEYDLQTYFLNFNQLCSSLIEYFKEVQDNADQIKNDTSELWLDINRYIEKNYSKKIQMQDLCSHFFISTKTLHNVFKSNTNKTFVEYLTYIRIEKSKQLLLSTAKPLAEIAEAVGIKDYYYFNKTFKRHTGVTPLKFRKQNGEVKD